MNKRIQEKLEKAGVTKREVLIAPLEGVLNTLHPELLEDSLAQIGLSIEPYEIGYLLDEIL